MNGKVVFVVLVVLAALAVSVTAVKDLDFALEYRGKCDYSADKSSANCHLKAQSQEVLTRIKYPPTHPPLPPMPFSGCCAPPIQI
jgi:hypothetical protein